MKQSGLKAWWDQQWYGRLVVLLREDLLLCDQFELIEWIKNSTDKPILMYYTD